MAYTHNERELLTDKIEQIEESIAVIRERTNKYDSIDELLSTPWGITILDACIMRLQVIGETIKSIDTKTHGQLLARFPSIPWRNIIGMRNIISHEYANIDYDVVWDVIANCITPLLDELGKIKTYVNHD